MGAEGSAFLSYKEVNKDDEERCGKGKRGPSRKKTE
jgi:hypothetical protein